VEEDRPAAIGGGNGDTVSTMASIEFRGIEKSFGPVTVLHGIELAIADGEFVVLVGPSGCGKSTLLRLLAGLDHADSGTIMIGGADVSDKAAKDRDIAMVFQSYALYPHMNVAQNMGFSLRLRRMSRKVIAERVRRAADILNLTDYLDRRPGELSGGQRQRVAMGRAIVRDPQVFLFDEPLSNLDAKLRVAMRSEIKGLHQRLKTTTVYVTHDQVEAMTMADRIAIMRGGRIEQVGRPLEVYDRPANRFVAEFIGSPAMNFLPAEIAASGALRVARLASGPQLPLPPGISASAGQKILVGIRPEAIAPSGDGVGLEGTVIMVEPTGAQVQIVASVGGRELVAVFNQRILPAPGDALTLRVDPLSVHLFDEASGRRLAG
jgi:multiple sugar transport system ATP-binding protein